MYFILIVSLTVPNTFYNVVTKPRCVSSQYNLLINIICDLIKTDSNLYLRWHKNRYEHIFIKCTVILRNLTLFAIFNFFLNIFYLTEYIYTKTILDTHTSICNTQWCCNLSDKWSIIFTTNYSLFSINYVLIFLATSYLKYLSHKFRNIR